MIRIEERHVDLGLGPRFEDLFDAASDVVVDFIFEKAEGVFVCAEVAAAVARINHDNNPLEVFGSDLFFAEALGLFEEGAVDDFAAFALNGFEDEGGGVFSGEGLFEGGQIVEGDFDGAGSELEPNSVLRQISPPLPAGIECRITGRPESVCPRGERRVSQR